MVYNLFLKKWKFDQIENLVGNLYDKKEYVIHMLNLKQALNHGLVLGKVYGFIKFNKKLG